MQVTPAGTPLELISPHFRPLLIHSSERLAVIHGATPLPEDTGQPRQNRRIGSPETKSCTHVWGPNSGPLANRADLGGASDLTFIFLFFCGRHQKHRVPMSGPWNWFPGLIFGATCAIFRAGARPKAPGARRGPQGPKIGQKPGAGFIIFSFPRSASPCAAACGACGPPAQGGARTGLPGAAARGPGYTRGPGSTRAASCA